MILALALALTAGGFATGLTLRILLRRLEQHATHREMATHRIIYRAFQSLAMWLPAITGVWAGLRALPLAGPLGSTLDRTWLVLVMILATLICAQLAGTIVTSYATHRAGIQLNSIFLNLTWVVVVAIGSLIVLQTIGISITPLLTALGVAGLAVALALQDTLSNLFAGVHLLASKKVRQGDYIRLDSGEQGYIVDITWRNTAIRQLPNNMVIVPNSRLASAIVTNYYRPAKELAVLVEVGVSYDSDLTMVERVTVDTAKEVMKEVPGGIPSHQPFIRYHTFNQSSVDFTVILRASEFTDQYLIKHDFIKRLHLRYRKEGIQIPFPIRTVIIAPKNGKAQGSLDRKFLMSRPDLID